MSLIGSAYSRTAYEGLIVELRNLDLNLLVTLDALLKERSVTRAAEQLGLSQPALSGSLGKLRRHFSDELLMRTGNSYQLTPLAAQLKRLTASALLGVDRVFAAQSVFDPLTCQREFLVLASDNAVGVLGRDVASVMGEMAPQARIRLQHRLTDAVDHPSEGLREVDALILPHGFLSQQPYLDLYTDEWVIVADENNTAIKGAVTLENLQELSWVMTFHQPTAFTTAAQLMRMEGIEPRVSIVTESYLAVPLLVLGSDRIALMQRQLAHRVLPSAGWRAYRCPFESGRLVQAMWWHPMYDRDPEHELLRDIFVEAAKRAVTGSPDDGLVEIEPAASS